MKGSGGLWRALRSLRPQQACYHEPRPAPANPSMRRMRWDAINAVRGPRTGSLKEYSTRSSHKKAVDPSEGPPRPTRHVLSQPMRAVMRQLPHPVVVITTLENTHDLSDPESLLDDRIPRPIPRAMTVSSFTSLSVDPVPMVTFNITLPSTTYQALARCGRFNAHILSGDDHGARIADLFTRGNRPTATEGGEGEADLGVLAHLAKLSVRVSGRDQWHQEWEQARHYGRRLLAAHEQNPPSPSLSPISKPSSGTLPVLHGRGVMHVLKCVYRKVTPPSAGDFLHHAIVVGEVLDIIPGESGPEGSIALAYADRAYRRPGEKLFDRPATTQSDATNQNAPRDIDISTNDTDSRKAD
ncbi:flavin reductase like domain-containing protein [Durotheca rogersii]|uniref:flavin reductase like domain-containing protein n=1 Tax=Durotheca rogersii TaxID=419775 RepID=UPI002220AECC|nr:flavin reductase like domain-containing protein [Durotheca rogersii]KAI5865255.1 flavin reductase like domain-containing protein [Durotheca rogersii]